MEWRRLDGDEAAAAAPRPDNEVPAVAVPVFWPVGGGRARPVHDPAGPAGMPVSPAPGPPPGYEFEAAAHPDGPDDADLEVGLDIFTAPPGGTAGRTSATKRSSRALGKPRNPRRTGGDAAVAARPPGRAGRPEPRRRSRESRYLPKLLAADLAVGLAAAGAAYRLPAGAPGALPGWAHFLLPPVLVVALGLAGAYERRFLFVGAEEFRRVARAGLSLMATVAVVSLAAQVPLARSYVLVALPVVTLAVAALRAVLRHRLGPHPVRPATATEAVTAAPPAAATEAVAASSEAVATEAVAAGSVAVAPWAGPAARPGGKPVVEPGTRWPRWSDLLDMPIR